MGLLFKGTSIDYYGDIVGPGLIKGLRNLGLRDMECLLMTGMSTWLLARHTLLSISVLSCIFSRFLRSDAEVR